MKMLSSDLNLIIQISQNGIIEKIFNGIPTSQELQTFTKNLIVNQSCPNCNYDFTLNVAVHQLLDIPMEPLNESSFVAIKQEDFEDDTDYDIKPEDIVEAIKTEDDRDLDSNEEADEKSKLKMAKRPKKSKKFRFRCSKCDKALLNETNLLSHEKKCTTILGSSDNILVCHQCKKQKIFSNRTKFYAHCKEKHQNQFVCPICRVKLETKFQWAAHVKNHNVDTFDCVKCQEKFSTKSQYLKHTSDHYKNDGVYCKLCETKTSFSLRSEFSKHIKDFHKSLKYPCPFCSKEFDEEIKLDSHFRTVHWTENRFFCQFCREKFSTKQERKLHNEKCTARGTESVGVEVECHYCGKKIPNKRNLEYHFKHIHGITDKTFVCDLCGQTFTSAYIYRHHLLDHKGNRYECHGCGKKSKTKSTIKHHILSKHYSKDLWKFYCDQCGEPFPTTFTLAVHKKKHIAARNTMTKCEICNQMFKTYCLEKHIQSQHTSEAMQKNFHCDKCEYSGKALKDLKEHKTSHLSDAEKKYQCQFCGKGFMRKNHRLRHERIHTDTRPHGCEACGKSFRHAYDLKSHLRQHTGEKPYLCQICDKRFSDRGCYRLHLLKHEKDLNISLDKSTKKKRLIIGVDVKIESSNVQMK